MNRCEPLKKCIRLRILFAGALFLILLNVFQVQGHASISFDRAEVNVLKGGSRKLGITCDSKKYKVYSSNQSIATVSRKGKVKGRKAGNCRIIVKCGAETASIPVHVMSSIRSGESTFIGHRGYQDAYPENTISAFKGALKYGAAGVEFDLWMTRSNDLLVFHDANLLRMCHKGLAIRDITAANLSSIKVKAHGKKDRIPTLEEALRFLSRKGKIAYIHLKEPHLMIGAGLDNIAECIRRNNMTGRAVVFCSSFDAIRYLKTYHPDITTGYLYLGVKPGGAPGEASWACDAGASYYYFFYPSSVTYENICYAHALGMKTGLYRTTKKKHVLDLLDYGADFIMLYHKLIKK